MTILNKGHGGKYSHLLCTGFSHPTCISDNQKSNNYPDTNQQHNYFLMPPPPVPKDAEGAASLPMRFAMQTWPKQGKWPISGLNIFMPGQLNHTLHIPNFFAQSPEKFGYQAAHSMYNKMCNYFTKQAYATNNMELVVVKVMMKWLKPGNKHPSIVLVSGSGGKIGCLLTAHVLEHLRAYQQYTHSHRYCRS
jgi:hypothetical protein